MQRTAHIFHQPTNDIGQLRQATFRELLGLAGRDLPNKAPRARVYDLGAGPCIFAKIAQDAGFDVTAVDGRDDRLPADVGRITFVKADVREFPISDAEIVVNLGLMYHLTLSDQVRLLERVPKGAKMIMDTQVHIRHQIPPEGRTNIGEDCSRDSYHGALYKENQNAMASIGNPYSFIHTTESQERLFENTGFRRLTTVVPHHCTKYGARFFYLAEK